MSEPPPSTPSPTPSSGDDYNASQSNENDAVNKEPSTPRLRKAVTSLTNSAKKRFNALTRKTLKLPLIAFHSDALDINKPRAEMCFVTHLRFDMTHLEFSHVIPESTKPNDLSKLEYAWGMEAGKLNPHTRHNLQALNIDLHRYFDDNPAGWGWFPPANIIKDMAIHYLYHEQTQVILDEAFVKQTTFEYKFFAFPRMKYVAIRTYGGPYPGGAREKDYKHHAYPFHSLPTYNLPIKPHYAIFDIGKKLADHFKEDKYTINQYKFTSRIWRELGYELDIEFGMRLFDCMQLYLHWMATILPRKTVSTHPFDQAGPSGPQSHGSSSPSRTSKPKTRSASRTATGMQGSGKELPGTIHSQRHMDALDLPIDLCLGDPDEEEDEVSSTMTVEEDDNAFMLRVKSWSEDVSQALPEPNGAFQLPSLSPSSSMESNDSTNSQPTTDIIVRDVNVKMVDDANTHFVPCFSPALIW